MKQTSAYVHQNLKQISSLNIHKATLVSENPNCFALMRLPGYLDNEWVADLDATNLQPGASPSPQVKCRKAEV